MVPLDQYYFPITSTGAGGGGSGSGTLFISENGEYDVSNYALASVNVASGGGESTLKKLLDATQSTSYLFDGYKGESVDDLISYEDTENVTNMQNMFMNCKALTEIPPLDTSKVTNMDYMFYNCYKLTAVSQLDTSKVTGMKQMFMNCNVLKTIPELNTSKVASMQAMFINCWNLTEIPQLDTSNVTNMQKMFDCSDSGDGNKYLKTIPQLNTSKVSNIQGMFSNCQALETIQQLNLIKVSSNNNATDSFWNCKALTNLTLLNIKVNLAIGSGSTWGHLLTLESLINTVKELINVGSAKTLTMGMANLEKIANTYVKFTDSSVTSIPTNKKGDVVVCESTDTGAMLLSDYALLKNWTLA